MRAQSAGDASSCVPSGLHASSAHVLAKTAKPGGGRMRVGERAEVMNKSRCDKSYSKPPAVRRNYGAMST